MPAVKQNTGNVPNKLSPLSKEISRQNTESTIQLLRTASDKMREEKGGAGEKELLEIKKSGLAGFKITAISHPQPLLRANDSQNKKWLQKERTNPGYD